MKKMKMQEARVEAGVAATADQAPQGADANAAAVKMADALDGGAQLGQNLAKKQKEEAAADPLIAKVAEAPAVKAEAVLAEVEMPAEEASTPPAGAAADAPSATVAPAEPAPAREETAVASPLLPKTDLEKRQRRAERFGLELMVSEGEKKRLRAARFGESSQKSPDGSKMSPTSSDVEAAKRKARAARFGVEEVRGAPQPAALEADEAKKKARLARFGLGVKVEPQDQEKKDLRAARFGLAKPADIEPEKKVQQPVAT